MLRNLIFDWFGTLAENFSPILDATHRSFHFGKPELELEESRARNSFAAGPSPEGFFPDRVRAEVDALYDRDFLERAQAVALRPHAREFLGFCRRKRRRLFLLSAMNAAQLAEQTARLGVAHFFEGMSDGPLIAPLLAAHDLAPAETAVIGDTVLAIESARRAGVMAIATLTGSESREQLGGARPDVTVRDLGDLQKLMELLPASDEILIEELEFFARVGVPEEERAQPQRLLASLRFESRDNFRKLGDELGKTVDYAAVCAEVQSFVRERTDRLIETLADALASHLIAAFGLARIEVELRKFVLPETKFVAVRVARQAELSAFLPQHRSRTSE